MKMLTFYSDSHKKIYKNYFLRSFNDVLRGSFKLNARYIDQISETADLGSEGFEETMFEKIEHIIDNIDVSSDEPIVYADCDIQFFRDFHDDILEELGDYNIKFQDDIVCACAGFFICKQNEDTLEFFKTVLETMQMNMEDGKLRSGISDQIIINNLIRTESIEKIGLLPKNKYYTVATSTGTKQWEGEKDFDVPASIMLHHGNWTNGIDNKIKLMRLVKNKVLKNVYY